MRLLPIESIILALTLTLAASPICAQDQKSLNERCIDGIICPIARYYPPKDTSMILTKNLRVELDEFVTQGDFLITTNGFELTIKFQNRIEINGTLTIRSFTPSDRPMPPKPAEDGLDSNVKFNSGPNTDGHTPCDFCPSTASECFACPGSPGGTGGPGTSGDPGVHGKSGGQVTLEFRDDPGFKASGSVHFLLRGQSGGKGGAGGNGGRGGAGEQGGKGYPSAKGGCSQEAQRGGNGGDGGDAGKGGPGGNAGNGGTAFVLYTPKSGNLKFLDHDVSPGEPGEGGDPGKPGEPGERGLGGQGFKGCDAAPPEKTGLRGKIGEPSNPENLKKMKGKSGQPGQPGSVKSIP